MGIIGPALEEIAWLATFKAPSATELLSTAPHSAHLQASTEPEPANSAGETAPSLSSVPLSLVCAHCGDASGHGDLGPKGTVDSCIWFCQGCWESWAPERGEAMQLQGSSDACGRCSWLPTRSCGLARAPPFCETWEAWLCPACWLQADADANPFRALDTEKYWLVQAVAFGEQCPPDPATIAAHTTRSEVSGADDSVPWGAITIFWDPNDERCALMVHALLHAFGSPLLRFVDFRDREATDAALARHPGVPWVPLCRQGGLSAVLANGLFISECEKHPKVLLYELKYRKSVTPACPDWAARIARMYSEPLAMLRAEFVQPSSIAPEEQWWWYKPEAMAVISSALAREKYVTIDGFLPDGDFERLMESCLRLHRTGQFTRGNRGHGKVESDDADLLNTGDRPRKWCMWDDNLTYCSDSDARAVHVGAIYTRALDALVRRLQLGGAGVMPTVAKRLEKVGFREKVMAACYRADTRGQYFQHVDSGGGKQRLLTTILYFNRNWTYEDGACNRMYHEGWFNTRVKADILPAANRLLVFWANEDCPHEVTAARTRDRYAMTVWYAHTPTLLHERLRNDKGQKELVDDFHPVAPNSFREAALEAVPALAGDKQLEAVAKAYEQKQAQARALISARRR